MNPHYKDFLNQLNESEVRFLVIGGYGVMAHSQPRFTNDIDVAIDPDPENAAKAFEAMARFGFPLDSLNVQPADLANGTTVVRFETPQAVIDVFSGLPHTQFAPAWQRRTIVRVEGAEVPVASIDDLLEMKEISGRPKDLADIQSLRQAKAVAASKIPGEVANIPRGQKKDVDPGFEI